MEYLFAALAAFRLFQLLVSCAYALGHYLNIMLRFVLRCVGLRRVTARRSKSSKVGQSLQKYIESQEQ